MRYLLVDGHSVIFGWPELRAIHSSRTSKARDLLVRHLTSYQDYSGSRVVVVFDGTGSKLTEESVPGGIQIFYAPAGATADSVIERLVAKYGERHEMTVATDDLMERQTSFTFGASTLSVAQLRSLLDDNEGALQREIKKRSRTR